MECAVKRVIISNDAHPSIGQRKWEFTPKSERVIDSCYLGSKKMTNLLRHRLELRESDGAVAWEKLLMHVQRSLVIQTTGARINGRIAQGKARKKYDSSLA